MEGPVKRIVQLIAFAACYVLSVPQLPAQADTFKCGSVSIQKGKPVFSVITVSATRCPKGYEVILNASDLSRQTLSSVPSYNGTAAGGALSGTYPNPDVAAGAIGPSQLSHFPSLRVSRKNSPLVIPSANGGTDAGFDDVTYNPDNITVFAAQTGINAPGTGTFLITATICWATSGVGSRMIRIGHSDHVNGPMIAEQNVAAAPDTPTCQTVSVIRHLVLNDVVFMVVEQTSGGSLSTVTSQFGEHASMTLQWIAP
jgi:hypothetical protein